MPRAAKTAQMRPLSPKPRFKSACRIALRMSRKVGLAGASRRPSVTSARARLTPVARSVGGDQPGAEVPERLHPDLPVGVRLGPRPEIVPKSP